MDRGSMVYGVIANKIREKGLDWVPEHSRGS
jgi:hypothetical protein